MTYLETLAAEWLRGRGHHVYPADGPDPLRPRCLPPRSGCAPLVACCRLASICLFRR